MTAIRHYFGPLNTLGNDLQPLSEYLAEFVPKWGTVHRIRSEHPHFPRNSN